ncbi:MAG: hypothetical protein AMS20_07220 [Gemmatimonas sp. SG8_28]|nr:MAG: hypothetical protein AMS20_07220 [Gemmatimonas sp. SG8_28]
MRKVYRSAVAAVLLASAAVPASARSQTADAVVRELYDLVTFEAGTTPDWDRVRSLFLDEAVIVLRTSRTANEVMSLDGFIGDWLEFIERANVSETGFEEKILRTVPLEFKDIAHVLVLYEAHIPGSPRPPQQGVDSFSLVRRDGAWLIAAVLNDIPDPQHPVPAVLDPAP